MSRDFVNRHCASLPGAAHSDPWGGGHDAWKVGGKMFALIGAMADAGLNVKCPDIETAELLIEIGKAERAPYLHRSWVCIRWDQMDEDELRHRIDSSYRLIRSGLPKKLQATLAPFPAA